MFPILSNGKKGSKKVQLVSKHCNKMSCGDVARFTTTFKQHLATNQVVAGCMNTDF